MSIVRCPECHSPFLIGAAQRHVAEQVRCGRCGHEFELPVETEPSADGDSDSGSTSESATEMDASLSARALEEELAAPVRRRASPRWILAAITVLLLGAMGLAAQYLWFNLDRLSQRPQFRPLLARFCTHLPCELPSFVDRTRLRILGLEVSEDARFKDVLRVSWVLHNQAPLAQTYPVLRLEFSTVDGKPVAGRDFQPADYLPAAAPQPLLPAGESLPVSFEILAPAGGALSYQLRVIE